MIDPNVFRVSRQTARLKLDPNVARESFGYYIDVPNGWESYRTMDDLLYVVGIHQTHEAQYPFILNDLGPLTAAEHDWARRFVRFYDRVQGLLTTSQNRTRLQFDIAETLIDWRTILKFVDLPARILDYGAGGGRQCVSAFLRHPGNVYAAVDSTLAAYTVQNIVFSLMDVLGAPARFVDFLDVEAVACAKGGGDPSHDPEPPSIAQAPPGSRFHVPAWFDGRPLPSRFFDAVLACHVHNELSGSDFLRLIAAVDRCLADDGVFYVRSELGATDVPGVRSRKSYMDALDLHGIDPVELLGSKGIVPVYCAYIGTFQTTVFARVGSRHHAMAQTSPGRDNQFLDVGNSWNASLRAGHNYTLDVLEWLGESGRRVAFCGPGGDTYQRLVAPIAERVRDRLVLGEQESIAGGNGFARRLAAFDPQVVVSCSDSWALEPIERNARAALGGEFKIRLQQHMPIGFLLRETQRPLDPILTTDIRVAGQIEQILGDAWPPAVSPRLDYFDRWPG